MGVRTGLNKIKKAPGQIAISVDEEKEAAHFIVPDIEKFGGNLPVVTIDRDNTKTAGNCKTNMSHVTDPEIIS